MVKLHVKKGQESLFLHEAELKTPIAEITREITTIHNGRLKVQRLCDEIEQLAKHGTLLPPEIMGLTDEQVVELKLKDEWANICVPSGGSLLEKDPIGRRNGNAPNKPMQKVLMDAIEVARGMIAKTLVGTDTFLTVKMIQEAIEYLKGAVTIVYPMKLPPHDIIRHEFENTDDLSGTQASLDVIEPALAQLYFSGKELDVDKTLSDYIGTNDKCKIIVKLQKRGNGPPAREPVIGEAEQKQLMMLAYRKQQEMRKLQDDDDDEYLNQPWADGKSLKRNLHGVGNVSWRPRFK